MALFEFDEKKSAANKVKHGIDFVEAQLLRDDVHAVKSPLIYPDEARFITVGKIRNKLWSAIFTWREGVIRLISVRRARKNEAEWYEENLG